MGKWTLDDIPWHNFAPEKVTSDLIPLVKAASLVERNSADYATYLCNVFPDDQEFQSAARDWALEEAQHGEALGRWAELADPGFDFRERFHRFTEGYRIPVEATASIRGSRSGELIARCVVECGTSSFYSALRDSTDEPVLKTICQRIAADEFRHYKLFYVYLQHYLPQERPWLLARLRVACGRFLEVGDDELSYAFHCANDDHDHYDRARSNADYARLAGSCYRKNHIDRAVNMMLKAAGVRPGGYFGGMLCRLAWRHVQRHQRASLAA